MMSLDEMKLAVCGKLPEFFYVNPDSKTIWLRNNTVLNPDETERETHWPSIGLQVCHEAEKLLVNKKPWSSSGEGDERRQYIHELGKIVGLKTREEMVVSVEEKDRHLINKRPNPWPHPIQMPPSAIILSHHIPAYGYEHILVCSTHEQRLEALCRLWWPERFE